MTPQQVAVEHILWAVSHGMTPTDVMASIGLDHWPSPDWHDVQDALAIKWQGMQRARVAACASKMTLATWRGE